MCTNEDPNNVQKSTTDVKVPVNECSHRKDKIQLLPIRYALVEQHKIAPEITPPHDFKSRPVGLRLMRDGWLYFYESTGLFYEYLLKDGQVTALLWCHKTIPDADKREEPQEVNPKLLFNRTSTLYICYSEIQWTMSKCEQILGSPTERRNKMQIVNLSSLNCSTGGKDLLTDKQCHKYLSELNDDQLKITNTLKQLQTDQTLSKNEDELKSYIWEKDYNKVINQTHAQSLVNGVDKNYQKDHAYLVINDEIGLLRDLAEYQDRIIELKNKWFADEKIQHQYVIGSYIESLYVINEKALSSVAKQAEQFKDFERDTTLEQRQTVVDYIEVKNRSNHREEWFFNRWFFRSDDYNQWDQDVENAKNQMQAALGTDLYKKYKDYIEAMDISTANALNGAKFGQQGIQDRIDRPAMEQCLAKQRRYLDYLNTLIEHINQDRRYLFNRKTFFTSAWYYCSKSEQQTLEHCKVHYETYKDLGITEDTLADIAKMMEEDPKVLFPILYTLPADKQDDTSSKLTQYTQTARGLFFAKKETNEFTKLSQQVKELIEQKAPHALNLSGQFGEVNAAVNTIYDPAIQKSMADAIVKIRGEYTSGGISLDDLIRNHYPKSPFTKLLARYEQSGLTLKFASVEEARIFDGYVKQVAQLRIERRTHKIKRREYERLAVGKGQTGNTRAMYQEMAVNEQQQRTIKGQRLIDLEKQIANSFSPTPLGDVGAGRIGVYFDGLSKEQAIELNRMSEDFRLGSGVNRSTIKAIISPKGGDFWAILMFGWQFKGFLNSIILFNEKEQLTFEDSLNLFKSGMGFFAATFGMAQGISATILMTTLEKFASTAGKMSLTMRFGACVEVFGIFGYATGLLSSIFGIADHTADIINARDNCNVIGYAGAVAAWSGSAGQAYMNGYALARSSSVIVNTYREFGLAGLSRGLFLQGARSIAFFARFSLITLAFTAVELGGEWLFNRFNTSRLDDWLDCCIWAKDPADRKYSSLTAEDLALNEIINTPTVTSRTHGIFSNTGPQFCRVSIRFPNLSVNILDTSHLSIAASILYDFHKRISTTNYTEAFISQLKLISGPGEPLTIAFDISPDMASMEYFNCPIYAFTLEYPATLHPKPVLKKITFSVDTFFDNGSGRTFEPFDMSIVWHDKTLLQPLITDKIIIDEKVV